LDLSLSPSEQAFRDELRAWLESNDPGPEPRGDEDAFEFRRQWQKKLHEGGWTGLSWPKEYGGRGATLIEQAIFNEELARSGRPQPANVLGLVMGGPVVITHGSDEQKERFLKPILTGDEIWCQGFSEPESGSDLASLKTKAVKSNGDWVVTGQKVWTTYAHRAKWCMLVARTDPDAPKHKGLTYFLMDMEQDGVQVRPLRQITGEAEFNELFIEEARIPDENVIGGVGNGWAVAITTLMHERAGLGTASAIAVKKALGELIELAKERGVADDQQAIKRTASELLAARFTAERVRELAEAGEYEQDAWKEICELGWPGIFIGEEHGGQGLGTVELIILMEELGYALAPLPFLSNAAAGLVLGDGGSNEQQERWLPGIASGVARGTAGEVRDGEAALDPEDDSAE